ATAPASMRRPATSRLARACWPRRSSPSPADDLAHHRPKGAQVKKELVFSTEEFTGRVAKMRERLEQRGVAGMLVHTPENIYYLTGYQTPGYYTYQALLVPTAAAASPVLLVRRLEESNVRALSWLDTRRVYTDTEDPVDLTATVVRESGLADRQLGIEKAAWFLTAADLERLQTLLPRTRIVDTSGVVEL